MTKQIFLCMLALSGGAFVGNAAAAFVTLLDIVPRMAQVSDTSDKIGLYEIIISLSAASISFLSLIGWGIGIKSKILLLIVGFILGIFVGLLASALAEVLNVMPVLFRRVRIQKYIIAALVAIALGKMLGSLFSWNIIGKH